MIKKMSTPEFTPEAKNLNERAAHGIECAEYCNMVCKNDMNKAITGYNNNEILL